MRKGSKEAKAWGRKMKRLREKPKTKRRKTTRKYTTRKRRTTRKGDLTLKRKRAYSPRRRRLHSEYWWNF
tara:strand:- start:227 stop:436 length:210 start_codon:yes stop_codon:yes gene_type:complete